ncbi:VOC family protein [Dactylosporangium sp. NPDC005572]|uniref:VOC family protein n=1 Tax=Dactylosporangium sp. NPDC005572 TaxID=3156889 RepID=UPI0033A3D379
MSLPMSAVMLGVQDLARARTFYTEGLGFTVAQDVPGFVALSQGAGAPQLALYEWEAAAQDAGVASAGSGFRGVSFHLNPAAREEVDETMRSAVAAGGSVVRAAAGADWGGYYGYCSDPDGHLWKITTYGSA